jgi:hypothetical protein
MKLPIDPDMFTEAEIRAAIKRDDEALRQREVAHKKAEQALIAANSQLFTIHTANDWVQQEKQTDRPKMLFGEFWYQGELCIMFADSNAGKSILAVQIGDGLTRGHNIEPFTAEIDNANVLYVDFELSAKQFEQRYNGAGIHEFGPTFYRAQFNPAAPLVTGFATIYEYVGHCLEKAIHQTSSKVIIIDNITNLRGGTERAYDALPLMNELKALKARLNLSILVLAHTPKRNAVRPITGNDLGGSRMLLNFCDSAFAIGLSRMQPGLRYVKQIKQRNSQQLYGAENVCLYEIVNQYRFCNTLLKILAAKPTTCKSTGILTATKP